MSTDRKIIELKNKIVDLSGRALAIADNQGNRFKSAAAQLAALKPLDTEIQDAQKELESLEYVQQRRKSLNLGEMATPGGPEASRPTRAGEVLKNWGAKVEKTIADRALATGGTKALINGQIDIPSVIREVVQMQGRPRSILQLIPQPNARREGNVFSYMVQSGRDLNARSVPDGAIKPTSGITFEDREDRYRVYAHITDPMPKRYLDDYAALISILRAQLGQGLIETLERDILLGTGVKVDQVVNASGVVTTQGEDPVLGILKTPGILTREWEAGSNLLQQLTDARYALEDTFVTPNAWVINSKDWQTLTQMREDGTTGALLFGTGRTSIDQFLGEYDRIITPLIPQGRALLGDFNETVLLPKEDDHLDIDGAGELFDRNQIKFRSEGRYGFATTKPSAFIDVQTADPEA